MLCLSVYWRCEMMPARSLIKQNVFVIITRTIIMIVRQQLIRKQAQFLWSFFFGFLVCLQQKQMYVYE